MTSQQRNILGLGSFVLAAVGVVGQFGLFWGLIVSGVVGVLLALILAVGAVR